MMGRGSMVLFTLVMLGVPAAAQTLSKGGVSGTIQTFRAVVGAAPTPPVAMLTTPAKNKVFVLTQACATNNAGFILDSGNPPLTIVGNSTQAAFKGNSRCVTYSPGLAIAPGATIFCNNADSGDTNSCLITGVLTKH